MDFSKLSDIRGKTVLVTGGSSGIGHMIAAGPAQAGCRVQLPPVSRNSGTLFRLRQTSALPKALPERSK